MNKPGIYNVKDAIDYANRGMIEAWVHEFLATKGGNMDLAIGLKRQKRYWAGPVEMELEQLFRCCGPEENMEYRQSEERFYGRVEKMMQSMENGWEAPPLIAVYDQGKLSVRDGNHRHEAVRRMGSRKYWVIIWFNDYEDYMKGTAEYGLPMQGE